MNTVKIYVYQKSLELKNIFHRQELSIPFVGNSSAIVVQVGKIAILGTAYNYVGQVFIKNYRINVEFECSQELVAFQALKIF